VEESLCCAVVTVMALGEKTMRSFLIALTALGFGALTLSASQSAATPDKPRNVRSFVVFFENNQASLTPEGLEIVKAAAERARRSHALLVTLAAPTGRVVAGYDPALASPRVATVQRELVADGVPQERVTLGIASNDVLVPLTGAERVEIRVVTRPSQENT
jgi:outer membrane protein OmpA-like peptidoglycan-associated protein